MAKPTSRSYVVTGGIKVIAWYFILVGVGAMFGVLRIAGQSGGRNGEFVLATTLSSAALGAFFIILGTGLLRGHRWAWRTAVVITGAAALGMFALGVVGLTFLNWTPKDAAILIVVVAFWVLLFWGLWRAQAVGG